MKSTDQKQENFLNRTVAEQTINYLRNNEGISFDEIIQKLAGWGETAQMVVSNQEFKQICLERYGMTVEPQLLEAC